MATYRLYRQEWVVAHTLVGNDNGLETLREIFAANYSRYVQPGDVIYTDDGRGMGRISTMKLLTPNLTGEFKHAKDATDYAEKQGWDNYSIVERGSLDDLKLRATVDLITP